MSQGNSVVVVGSLNADLTIYCERLPNPGETVHGNGFAVNPGGKSANQAVAAAKLGASVRMVGAVGADANGDMLLDSVSRSGADVTTVLRRADVETGVAVISVDHAGENTIVISAGANGTLTPSDVTASVFDGAAAVCLCLEVPLNTVLAAARAGRDAGAQVLVNLSPFADIDDELARIADVLLVNVHEAALFLGTETLGDTPDWPQVRARFADRGVRRVVVTLGKDGSVVLDSTAPEGDRDALIAPTRVTAVDTTGAGDAFTGALAARLAAGDSLVTAARFASVASALATTAKGTQAAYADSAAVSARLGD